MTDFCNVSSVTGRPWFLPAIRFPALSLLGGLLGLGGAPAAWAQASSPGAIELTGNLAWVSEYRFRGIDQTWGRPALQGGVDVSFAQGYYAGLWASQVSTSAYPGGGLEVDYYAGYNGKLDDDWGYTLGGYGYVYPGANVLHGNCTSAAWRGSSCSLPDQRYNTFEVNGGVSWRWLSYKLSVSLGDYFGANPSTGYSEATRGSFYHDLTANYPLTEDLSLIAHLGYTRIPGSYNGVNPSYADYRVGLTRNLGQGWSVSGSWVRATNDALYRPPGGGLSAANDDTRILNGNRFILQVGVSF